MDWLLVVFACVLAVGVALLVWGGRLQRVMSPAERERGRRDVRRLYGSWSFITAALAMLVTMTALVAEAWPQTVGALVVALGATAFAIRRWRLLKRQP